MVEVVPKKPLFAGKMPAPKTPQKEPVKISAKKREIIIAFTLLFMVLVILAVFLILGTQYGDELAAKTALLIPFLAKKD